MKWSNYAKDHRIHFLLLMVLFLFIEGILLLFHTTLVMQIFLFFGIFLIEVVIILYDYFRRKGFYQELEEKVKQLEKKYFIIEMMEKPSFLEGRLIYDELWEIMKSMNDEIENHARLNEEFKQYINTWVHEIKLPLSAIKLIAYNNKGTFSRKLLVQIKRMDLYIEQVLYYIRSEVPEKDYVISTYSLKDIIDTVIKENKDSLIFEHFQVENIVAPVEVLTDKKWLSFMLGQIINNAIKYAKPIDRCLKFDTQFFKDTIRLGIEDHGIGIKKEDISRIFEKSFTGKNGRSIQHSTGMGLYLCKKLCKELGHEIEAESVKNSYTRIIITMKYKITLQ